MGRWLENQREGRGSNPNLHVIWGVFHCSTLLRLTLSGIPTFGWLAGWLVQKARMSAHLPRLATRSPDDLRSPRFGRSRDMGGFTISFMIPFERIDIYDELVSTSNPLGSPPNVVITVLREGYSGGMSAGCVRRVGFVAPFYGETISELMVAERGPDDRREHGKSCIVWRQLESSTRLNLLGERSATPEFEVELEGGPGGTLVTLYYNFARAEMRGPLCFLAGCMPSLLKWHMHASVVTVWHMEMVRRNFVPLRKPTFGHLVRSQAFASAR